VILVDLTDDEFLGLSVNVNDFTEDGYERQDGVCRMGTIVPPVKAWEKPEYTYTLSPGDGRGQVAGRAAPASPTARPLAVLCQAKHCLFHRITDNDHRGRVRHAQLVGDEQPDRGVA
jgi:hypothetical protein